MPWHATWLRCFKLHHLFHSGINIQLNLWAEWKNFNSITNALSKLHFPSFFGETLIMKSYKTDIMRLNPMVSSNNSDPMNEQDLTGLANHFWVLYAYKMLARVTLNQNWHHKIIIKLILLKTIPDLVALINEFRPKSLRCYVLKPSHNNIYGNASRLTTRTCFSIHQEIWPLKDYIIFYKFCNIYGWTFVTKDNKECYKINPIQ